MALFPFPMQLERTALGGHRAVVRCDATGANFGEDVVTFSFGMTAVGCSLSTEPPFACSDVTVSPSVQSMETIQSTIMHLAETTTKFHQPVHCRLCGGAPRQLQFLRKGWHFQSKLQTVDSTVIHLYRRLTTCKQPM
jgi:hypothetical protein